MATPRATACCRLSAAASRPSSAIQLPVAAIAMRGLTDPRVKILAATHANAPHRSRISGPSAVEIQAGAMSCIASIAMPTPIPQLTTAHQKAAQMARSRHQCINKTNPPRKATIARAMAKVEMSNVIEEQLWGQLKAEACRYKQHKLLKVTLSRSVGLPRRCPTTDPCLPPCPPLYARSFHRRIFARPASRVRSGDGSFALAAMIRRGPTGKENAVSLPDFSMRQLLEAGAHFGHQSHRWNPKMAPYIYGSRNSIHIIDLAQTVPLLHQALKTVSDTVAKGGRVLFVGTKRQAAEEVAAAAKRCAQYFVNSRWLGGTLTNWKTISASISRLRKLDEQLSEGAKGLTKKERLMLTREREKLEKALGGIKDMGGVPDLVFVIDTNKEALAIKEANRLKIPVIAIIDTNSDPDGIAYPVPANDDASRAIQLYCELVSRAAIDGISRSQGAAGVDIGEAEAPIAEPLPEAAEPETFPAEQFELLTAPRGAPDDLAKLTGVGPQIIKKLNEHGVFHYWQLAAMTPAEAEKLDADLRFSGRISRDHWVDQARALITAA